MKKLSFLFILMLVISLLCTPANVFAQTGVQPTATPSAETQTAVQNENTYAFRDLGYSDQILNGPYDYIRYRFSLPNTWALTGATSVQLKIKNVMTSTTLSDTALATATGATLDISFNSKWVTTLVLDWVGERSVTVPIPAEVLSSPTGQYSLSIYLDAGIDCEFEHQTTVVISADSTIDLRHTIVDQAIDLTQFPRPLYQPNRLVVKTNSLSTPGVTPAVLVTPDKPSVGELQAALTISAGLAHLTGGMLPVSVVPVSALTEAQRANSHLVFVGKGSGFATLSGIALPAAFNGAKFNAPGAQPEDGVIQAVVSPWNAMNVLMVISSETDAGLIKAAQALSTGTLQTGNRSDLAVVSQITPDQGAEAVPVDRTLAELGYASIQMGGMKYNPVDYMDISFYVPAGQTIDGEAYVDVVFTNSSLLNMDQSGLSVLLNGHTIGGIGYTKESSEKVTTQRVVIPGFLLLPGTNLLTIEANNHPLTYCSDLMYQNAWTTVFDQTLIHLPLTPATAQIVEYATLANLTSTFTTSPNLDTLAFVVAPDSSAAVDAAAKIAYQLGAHMNGDMVEFNAAYADQIDADYRQDRDLVLVGKASQIPLLAELADQLPASFADGSNVAQESIFRVVYRLPEDTSIGYLELTASPWGKGRNILAVLGSTDAGLLDSSGAVSVSELSSKLGGDFAVVRGEQILTSDTRLGVGTGNLSGTLIPETPAQTQVPDAASTLPATTVPLASQTGWILPVVGILSGVILVIIVIALATSKRNR
ncbi:bacterial cellulose synthase subunit [Longilinea arvoryzae]|uniref:Bacterial cellulose synthase subunit n=1 Tax=Longilinea arvoryzae TaxID=360412 RepID=A0A0S7BJX3_9CHLR|nr:cellulose biosynthesis cyclic di-GMP-binding regulatory protein BcsB [Longilinea arvoryzae]GAP14498.1 bacterial cellulose synthase subunit [Longilinea arvoryzae]